MSETDPTLFEIDPQIEFLGQTLPRLETLRISQAERTRHRMAGHTMPEVAYFEAAFDAKEDPWMRVASVYVGTVAYDMPELAREAFRILGQGEVVLPKNLFRVAKDFLNYAIAYEKRFGMIGKSEHIKRFKTEKELLTRMRIEGFTRQAVANVMYLESV